MLHTAMPNSEATADHLRPILQPNSRQWQLSTALLNPTGLTAGGFGASASLGLSTDGARYPLATCLILPISGGLSGKKVAYTEIAIAGGTELPQMQPVVDRIISSQRAMAGVAQGMYLGSDGTAKQLGNLNKFNTGSHSRPTGWPSDLPPPALQGAGSDPGGGSTTS